MSLPPLDWRNQHAYPSPETQSDLAFWAWQFLRRNPLYQAEWRTYVAGLEGLVERRPEFKSYVEAICSTDPMAKGEWDRSDQNRIEGTRVHRYESAIWNFDPPFLPEEKTFAEYWARMSETKQQILQRKIEIVKGEMFGISHLQPPGMDTFRTNVFLSQEGPTHAGHGSNNPNNPNYLALEFDLRLSVESLRKQVEYLFMARDDRIKRGEVIAYAGRPQRAISNYGNYLRVLDAIQGKATGAEIASALLPHQELEGAKKTVRNWTLAAIKLRDETYRTLPA